jgi:hypothetical protein
MEKLIEFNSKSLKIKIKIRDGNDNSPGLMKLCDKINFVKEDVPQAETTLFESGNST